MSNNSHISVPKIITKSINDTNSQGNTMSSNRSASNTTDQLTVTDCNFLTQNKVKSRIDYLTVQFKPNSDVEFKYVNSEIIRWLASVGIKSVNTEPNLKYFDQGSILKSNDELNSHCGAIKWNDTNDLIQVELSGNGCAYINANDHYFFIIKSLSKIVTVILRRIDIAVDTLDLKHGLRFMQQAYSKGLYSSQTGANPIREDTSSVTGKSILIGSRHSHKQILGYEKGKESKYPKDTIEYSNLFRHEVRLKGRKSQPIPIDALFEPDSFFVGAYPNANRRILKNVSPRIIKREVIQLVDKTLRSKLAYAKHQVGKTIFGAINRGLDSEIIVQTIMRKGKKDNICYPSFVSKQDLENYVFENK
jgi:DNA relaxase NicK